MQNHPKIPFRYRPTSRNQFHLRKPSKIFYKMKDTKQHEDPTTRSRPKFSTFGEAFSNSAHTRNAAMFPMLNADAGGGDVSPTHISKIHRKHRSASTQALWKPGENEKEVIVAMVIDNLQTYRKENISSRSCTLLSSLSARGLAASDGTRSRPTISRVRRTKSHYIALSLSPPVS